MPSLTLQSQFSSPPAKAISPIASWRHTLGLVCIFLGSTAAGAYFQLHGKGHAQGSTTSHVPLYLCVIGLEYGLFRYIKAGILSHGLSIRDLLGEPWNASLGMLRDLGLALGFWAVWKGGETLWFYLFPVSHAVSIQGFLPRKPLEIALWIGVSISAGISEEIAFRGYFQRQFWSLTGNQWAAVCLQGILFGMGHGYQGAQAMLRIAVNAGEGHSGYTVHYDEGLKVGYRYYDMEHKPVLFPFGYGLSYTTFRFSDLKISGGATPTATFTVTNTGKRAGAEVAELYAMLPPTAEEPPKRLVGFDKVMLQPGESHEVTIQVDPLYLGVYSDATGKMVPPAGEYTFAVGGSSESLALQQKVSLGGNM